MKKILSFIVVVVFSMGAFTTNAQTYFLGNGFTNGGTVTTCTGFFYDDGINNNYGNNQNYTVTFVPGSTRYMQLNFLEMGIALSDSLEVFDGLTVAAPRLALFNAGNNFLRVVTASSTNTSRALTVRFRSDASAVGLGWRAQIRCAPLCQTITGGITINGAAPDTSGSFLVCANTPLLFAANVTYPQSAPNPYYTQTNALNRFSWEFGGLGADTNALAASSLRRTIVVPGGYNIKLTIADTNLCQQVLTAKVKTSIKPTVNALGGNICFGDTSTINATFQPKTGYFLSPPLISYYWGGLPPFGDQTGSLGICTQEARDSIIVNRYAPGTTISNANDLVGVTVKMEHSFIGDFDLKLIAPDGTVINLKTYANNNAGVGSVALGEPVDNDATPNIEGKGYVYRFTMLPSATQTWMQATNTAPNHTYLANDGLSYTNDYLPAGDYRPETSFTTLANNRSPVNGVWKMTYCDLWQIDNGKIFYWQLDFAPSVPLANGGSIESYNIGIKDARFLPATGLVSSNTTGSSTTGRVFPPVPLVYNYVYRVTDSANCVYDTVVKVFANPKPLKASLGGDTVICRNTTSTLRVATTVANTTYQWYSNPQGTGTPLSTGPTFITPVLASNTVYYVKSTNLAQCTKIDTISVRVLQPIAKPVVTVTPALNTLTFNWQTITGATGYQVSLDSGITYITPSSGANGLSHTIAGLHPFETRSLIVRALGPVACQNSDTSKAMGTTLLDELYIPNAFTPNNDGRNDIWKPYGWLIKEMSLKIFNQYGQMIYSTTNPSGGWDGMVNGKAQPVGVYVYVMRVVDQNGRLLERKGAINLVR